MGAPFPGLNDQQRAAATFGTPSPRGVIAGPLLVIAGAGTGKTSTLAHRVAQLTLSGVDPARILLLTFTRRAAEEMTRRAEHIVAANMAARVGAVRLPWAGTFHSIANRLLRSYAREIGLDPGFSVIDRGDSADLLDVIRHEQGLSAKDKRFPRKDTCLAIYSQRVNTQWSLERTLAEQWPWCSDWHEELTGLFRAYVERKTSYGVLDYDDLLLYWHGLVQEPALAQHVGQLFDHILVDEYQDTNALQAAILLAIRPDGAGLTVVGDDAQAICSFRAATVDNIRDFPSRFDPHASVIALEENFRSTQPVLDAANALMGDGERLYPKALRARRAGGARPKLVTVEDERAQADYVVEQVLRVRETGVPLRRQAVLFRASHHSDYLEIELARRNVPFVKYGGLKFLEAAHVKDLLACLRWADNPRHQLAAFRVLQLLPGMGPATSRRCLDTLASHDYRFAALARYRAPEAAAADFATLIALLAELAPAETPWPGQVERVARWYRPQLERRYEAAAVRAADIEQLVQLATQYPTRERFLSELTLDPPQATGDLAGPPLLDEDYLVLSTIHSAKGMEWNSVFVLNVADGNFPSEFATGKAELIEEERRLLYVAMTRARDELYLLAPLKYYVTDQRRYGAAHVYGARSRFLTDSVCARLEPQVWPLESERAPLLPPAPVRIDVAARLKSLWD